jgi:hypothetical protein
VDIRKIIREEMDWGDFDDALNVDVGYIIKFPFPWPLGEWGKRDRGSAQKLFDALEKRDMNSGTGTTYDADEDGHNEETEEYLRTNNTPQLPKHLWFDKEYFGVEEFTDNRRETEISEIYVYPDNGTAFSEGKLDNGFFRKWVGVGRSSVPEISAEEVFPELFK